MLENFRLIKDEEQNWAYDPTACNNGGGYHQPIRVWEFDHDGNHYEFEDNDTSCGDFGRRYSKTLYLISSDGSKEEIGHFSFDQVDSWETVGYGTFRPTNLTANLIAEGLISWNEFFMCEFMKEEEEM